MKFVLVLLVTIVLLFGNSIQQEKNEIDDSVSDKIDDEDTILINENNDDETTIADNSEESDGETEEPQIETEEPQIETEEPQIETDAVENTEENTSKSDIETTTESNDNDKVETNASEDDSDEITTLSSESKGNEIKNEIEVSEKNDEEDTTKSEEKAETEKDMLENESETENNSEETTTVFMINFNITNEQKDELEVSGDDSDATKNFLGDETTRENKESSTISSTVNLSTAEVKLNDNEAESTVEITTQDTTASSSETTSIQTQSSSSTYSVPTSSLPVRPFSKPVAKTHEIVVRPSSYTSIVSRTSTLTPSIPLTPPVTYHPCHDLYCEFGYKNDIYGQQLCACANPCADKKCNDREAVCKILKIDDKYVGICADRSTINKPAKCYEQRQPGTCKRYESKFFWDSFNNKCQHFIFTGCNGNGNNFDTKERCQAECNTCTLPASKGTCAGSVIRYHFDQARGACIPFSYGGCGGNDNNFATRQQCERTCSPRTTSQRRLRRQRF